MKKRIRIFFVSCPSLDTDALSYLLLAQNNAQDVFQFEIYHHWIYAHRTSSDQFSLLDKLLFWYGDKALLPFRRRVDLRNRSYLDQRKSPAFSGPIRKDTWLQDVKECLSGYDTWYQSKVRNGDATPCPTIVITQASIEGGFISFSNGPFGLISAANWREFFSPVSVLEYILFSVQRLSLRMSYSGVLGSHYPLRGCVWDYDDHQPDARIATLLGYICETCKSGLSSKTTASELAEIDKFVKNDWIYDIQRPSSPASVLAKTYKYDLIKTKGLNSSFLGRLASSLESNIGSILSDGIKWVFIVLALLVLTNFFPDLLGAIKKALGSLA